MNAAALLRLARRGGLPRLGADRRALVLVLRPVLGEVLLSNVVYVM